GGTALQTIIVTITGTNERSEERREGKEGITEDVAIVADNLNTSGSITFTDVDTDDTHTAAFAPQAAGYLGSFTLDSTSIDTGNGGTVGWSFQVADGATDYLQAGQTLTQKYDVTVSDGHGGTALQTITVTITGTNEDPVIASHTDGAVTEDVSLVAGNLNTSGSITFTDVDTADTHTAAFAPQAAGYLGSFTLDSTSIDTGNGGTVGWSFQVADGATDYLQAGQTLTQKYDVTVSDGHGGTALQTIAVTITGTNEDPVIASHTDGAVTEDVSLVAGNLNTSGSITFTDVDTADTHTAAFAPQAAGYLGSFTLDST